MAITSVEPQPDRATLKIEAPNTLVAELLGKGPDKKKHWYASTEFVTMFVAITSIILTAVGTYLTQRSARRDDLLNAEWVTSRRLQATTLDSLYWRLGQELRAISDRRNTMIGKYKQIDLKTLNKRIAESDRIDDNWRDEVGLWDLRIRRYVDTSAVRRWDGALAALRPYDDCVDSNYRAWQGDGFRYRASATCEGQSIAAHNAVDSLRDAVVRSYRDAKPPVSR